ncbi:MAG: preprotein translocase subunit SecG [Lachnospira sp.]|nr:preprotein translocase subunit SecG [Lachnospira sp.]
MSVADTIRVLLMGVFILVCIFIAVLVLMQESKQNGLPGAISGAADTYWGKNKGRSMEGKLVLFTKILVVAFFVIAAVLNINF